MTTVARAGTASYTLTYSDRFFCQVATLASARRQNIRSLVRELCAREVQAGASEIARARRRGDTAPAGRRREPGPASGADVRTHTLTFPGPLYRQIRALAAARQISVRELIRLVCKREIERAVTYKEVGGPLFEGPIGEDPYDLVLPQAARVRRPA